MTEDQSKNNHVNHHEPLKKHTKKLAKSKIAKDNNQLLIFVFVISIAVSLAAGYLAGTYNRQIVALMSPVFGGKVYSAGLDLARIEDTYEKLASKFDGSLDKSKLIEGANRGLVEAAGDDYTTYMSSSEAREFDNSLSGNIGGGIGAEVGLKNGKTTIMRVLKDNPAERAGLMAGDFILKVNDQSTDGWTVERAVSLIRGEKGTTVKIAILRGTETKEFTITRDTINNPSVEGEVIDGIGIMTISRFDERTGALARAAAQDFKKQGVKGVVLDLRGNGGGYVDAAKDVAGLWLSGKIIATERVNSAIRETIKSGDNAILEGLPTSVLVNGSSASASEIVSGALKDYGVAKLVGEKTFGKGSVQQLINLDDGAELKVTVAKWYTPKGKNINKEGITPDITASFTQDDINKDSDPQLDAAKKALGL